MARIRRSCFRIIVALLATLGCIFVSLVGFGAVVLNQNQSATKVALDATASIIALTPTDTPTKTPTPTRTFTPTTTLTPSPTFTASITYTPSKTPIPTTTPTLTNTPQPTVTPQQTPTDASASLALMSTLPTSTADDVMVTILVNTLNVRNGPGTGYDKIGQVHQGETYVLRARTLDQSWALIDYVTTQGWISTASDVVRIAGKLSDVTVRNLPTKAPVRAATAASSGGSSGGAAGGSGECPGFNYTCSQLTCEQAYACLRQGNRQLDGNGDGIPCNAQCR